MLFFSLAPRTQSIYFLHWAAIVLSSSSNNDDDDGGHGGDGDDDGDGDGDGEEKIPQLYIYKLPINRPSGRILGVIIIVWGKKGRPAGRPTCRPELANFEIWKF